MKEIKLFILSAIMFVGITTVNAQDADSKWALSFGLNAVDFTPYGAGQFGDFVGDYFSPNDWNAIPAISHVSVARYTNYGLSVKLDGSLNKINHGVDKDDADGLSFFSINAAAVYDLNHLFGETGWFDPYVALGVGGTWVDQDTNFTVNPGYGFNTWFNDTVGLSFSSNYKVGMSGKYDSLTSPVSNKTVASYFQHSLGLIVRFNGDE